VRSKRSIVLMVSFSLIFLAIGIFPWNLSASAANYTDGFVPATDKNIRYLGRWEKQPNGACYGYFESGLEFAFTGTSLAIELDGISGILYSIDGSEYTDITAPKGKLVAATGLPDGEHLLKLYSRFETGRPKIAGFHIDKGAKSLPVTEKPKIEFIGDSITVGWIGRNYMQYNNLRYSYAFLTGEALRYSHNTVAFGGITVVPGAGSPDNSGMINRYFKLSEYNQSEPDSPAWDTSKYTPDYIVINLGTNDVVTEKDFKKGYAEFLKKLRDSYPKAVIFAMSPFGGKYSDGVYKAVQSRINEGDNSIFFIDTRGWISWRNTTDGVHLTKEAHETAAQKLTAILKQYTTNRTTPNTTALPIKTANATTTSNSNNTIPNSGDAKTTQVNNDTSSATGTNKTAESTFSPTENVATTSGISENSQNTSSGQISILNIVIIAASAILIIGAVLFIIFRKKLGL
jgi:lysophospholipase L1-like esterase